MVRPSQPDLAAAALAEVAKGRAALRLVMIGPPASGKGTQARRLARACDLSYLSTGALLREHIAKGSEIGRLAQPILERGGYLPDDCMCAMVGKWLEQAGPSWILDGFPRSPGQADFLAQWLERRGWSLSGALALEAPCEVLEQRIAARVECPACRWSGGAEETDDHCCPECGQRTESREDDTLENFRSRHRAYFTSAKPLIESYRARGELCACEATGSRDEVTSKLLHQLKNLPLGLQ